MTNERAMPSLLDPVWGKLAPPGSVSPRTGLSYDVTATMGDPVKTSFAHGIERTETSFSVVPADADMVSRVSLSLVAVRWCCQGGPRRFGSSVCVCEPPSEVAAGGSLVENSGNTMTLHGSPCSGLSSARNMEGKKRDFSPVGEKMASSD